MYLFTEAVRKTLGINYVGIRLLPIIRDGAREKCRGGCRQENAD